MTRGVDGSGRGFSCGGEFSYLNFDETESMSANVFP